MNLNKIVKSYNLYQKKEDSILAENYYGYDAKKNKEVYVKVISNKKVPDPSVMRKQLMNEIMIHESLRLKNSKNVLCLIDQALTENNIYLIYSNNRFETMRTYLNYKQMLTEKECINYFIQIYYGYCESYSQKVSYRDITLSNILIGEEYNIKIDDFGLFKFLFNQKNSSLQYRINEAPETQKDRTSYTREKSDSWSLGIILYELLFLSDPYFQQGQLIIPSTRLISYEMVSFLSVLLSIDPSQRIGWVQILSHPCIKNFILDQKKKEDWNLQLSFFLNPQSANLASRYPEQALTMNFQDNSVSKKSYNILQTFGVEDSYQQLSSQSLQQDAQNLKQQKQYSVLSQIQNQSAQFKFPIEHMMPIPDNLQYTGFCYAADYEKFLVNANESILRQSQISSTRGPSQNKIQNVSQTTQLQNQNTTGDEQKYQQIKKSQQAQPIEQNITKFEEANTSQQKTQTKLNTNMPNSQHQQIQQYQNQQPNYNSYQLPQQHQMKNSSNNGVNTYNQSINKQSQQLTISIQQSNQQKQQQQYEQMKQSNQQQQYEQMKQSGQVNKYSQMRDLEDKISDQKYTQHDFNNNSSNSHNLQQQQQQQNKQSHLLNNYQNNPQMGNLKDNITDYKYSQHGFNNNNNNSPNQHNLQQQQQSKQSHLLNNYQNNNSMKGQQNTQIQQQQYQQQLSLNSIPTNQSQDMSDLSIIKNDDKKHSQNIAVKGTNEGDDFNMCGNNVQQITNESIFLVKKKQKMEFINKQNKKKQQEQKQQEVSNNSNQSKQMQNQQQNTPKQLEEIKKIEQLEQQILQENLRQSLIVQNQQASNNSQKQQFNQMDTSKKIQEPPLNLSKQESYLASQSGMNNKSVQKQQTISEQPALQTSKIRGQAENKQDEELKNIVNDKQIFDMNIKILQQELDKFNVLAQLVERAEDLLQAKNNFWVVVSFFVLKKLYLIRKELEEQLESFVKVDDSLEKWDDFCSSTEYQTFMDKLRKQNEIIYSSLESLQKLTQKRIQRLNPSVSSEIKKHVPLEDTDGYSANFYVHIHFHIISLQEALYLQTTEAQIELLKHIIQLQDTLLIVEQGLFVNNEDFFSLQQHNLIQMASKKESLQAYLDQKTEKSKMFLQYYRSMGYEL